MSKIYHYLILFIVWTLYFYLNYIDLFNLDDTITLRTEIISFIDWVFWFIITLWFIWFINRVTEYFIHKYSENNLILFVTDFAVKFIAISKYLIAFYVLSYFAILPDNLSKIVNHVYSISLIIVIIFFATWFVNNFFTHDLIQKSKLKALSKSLLPVINKAIIVFIWVIWIITIFDNLGYDISALIAWAWIWGLAIAFAAQKSISNIFGAITILLNKPFTIWDYVTVNWITWTVKDIWLSYLTITDKMWHQVMIPNEVIISTNVENFTVRKNRRTDFSIWLVYGTTLEKMQKAVTIIESILEEYKLDSTISSYRVNFDMFWDFSLNIQATYFSLLNKSYVDYIKQKEEINLEIKKRFKTARLEMAFPTQELILKKED
jgi:MscS family membrane protein